MLNGVAALVAAMSPMLSKHRPLVPLSVALPMSVVLAIVTAGVGAPLAARAVFANFTRENVPPELLDQRLPEESKASSQGPWIELFPSSVRVMFGVRSGVSIPLPTTGRFAAANSTIDVPTALMAPVVLPATGTPPLLATQRLPALSKATPNGPLKAAELMTTAGTVAFVPVALNWEAVNTSTVLLL